jgi:hypothetical protein
MHDAKPAWPTDLKIFASLSAVWAVALMARVIAREVIFGTPIQAVIGGMKFYGDGASMVLLIEAAIFATFAIGIATEQRWGLMLALFYLAEVVISHLVFVITYFHDLGESAHVRFAAAEGPAVVLILLYVWIRSRDLLARP